MNRFYAPDLSATAQLLTDLAEHLAARGIPVTVITSRLSYDGAAGTLPARETINGVAVRRVWTTRFGRAGLWGRAVDYLSFYFSATLALLAETRPGDTILAKTDPPLMSIPAALVRRLRRARLVNWCQDLFPEIAACAGIAWIKGPLGYTLTRLRNRSLRRADANVVLNQPMRAHLLAQAVPDDRIRVIHNWPHHALAPTGRRRSEEAASGQPAEPFTICYSGNLGRVHNVAAIIELIERTRDIAWPEAVPAPPSAPRRCTEPAPASAPRAGLEPTLLDRCEAGRRQPCARAGQERGGEAPFPRCTCGDRPGRRASDQELDPVAAVPATPDGLRFRFVGGGVGQARLKAAMAERGWRHLRFEPYAPRDRLNDSLGRCDAHLITLDPACEGLIQPSKIYGILAVGRPAIFVGSRAGGVARILDRHDAGLVRDPARLAELGAHARTAYERHYSPPPTPSPPGPRC